MNQKYYCALKKHGLNEIASEKPQTALMHLFSNMKDPLIILLLVLALISFLINDLRAMYVILVMVLLGIVLRFFQELRANNAAQKLKAMVSSKVMVLRNHKEKQIPLKMLVPGDIVRLAAGDMIPADVRILSAKDLFLNQAPLTGETLPVEKTAEFNNKDSSNPFEINNLCFLGSDVVSGTALAIVINTGTNTYFGELAKSVLQKQNLSSFDKGINSFVWLMIRFILIMVTYIEKIDTKKKEINIIYFFLFFNKSLISASNSSDVGLLTSSLTFLAGFLNLLINLIIKNIHNAINRKSIVL